MAMKLPNGARLEVGTLGTSKPVTGISNATEGVASAVAHGLTAGSAVVLTSGWDPLNEAVFEVGSAPTADTFKLAGVNTTDAALFPAGQGAGTAIPITGWQRIPIVLTFALSGGDAENVEVDALDASRKKALPGGFSALTAAVSIADDPALPHYAALKAASQKGGKLPFKLTMKDGRRTYFYGYVSFSGLPSIEKNNVMANKLDVSVCGDPTRY